LLELSNGLKFVVTNYLEWLVHSLSRRHYKLSPIKEYQAAVFQLHRVDDGELLTATKLYDIATF